MRFQSVYALGKNTSTPQRTHEPPLEEIREDDSRRSRTMDNLNVLVSTAVAPLIDETNNSDEEEDL